VRGGALAVAVGAGGTIVTSPDGVNWTDRTSTSSTTAQLNAVAYNGSVYAAVGVNGTIVSSADAVTWTSRTSGTTKNLRAIAANGNLFFAVGPGGTVVMSADGTTWYVASEEPYTSDSLDIKDLFVVSNDGLIQ